MIKVLKHGKAYKKAHCDGCGCVFKYGFADIEAERKTSFGDETFDSYAIPMEKIYFIRCPECGKRIRLNVI